MSDELTEPSRKSELSSFCDGIIVAVFAVGVVGAASGFAFGSPVAGMGTAAVVMFLVSLGGKI
jgi:hypothetical protein